MAVILVTGSNGQLGRELQDLASVYGQHQFCFFTKDALDIANKEAVLQKFKEIQPGYCINCAAYTAVDKAETEKEKAFAINATGTENLAIACKLANAKLIHISTDYVFNGQGKSPYKESDQTDAVNLYGASKLQGEQLAMKANQDVIIIRTSWVYSFYGNNFVKTMLRLMSSRPEINVVSDQVGSPTYAADLAEAILRIIDAKKWEPGIYHYSNEGVISWFDFAEEIKKYAHLNCTVHPIPTEQYPTPAKRPAYSVLDKTKFVERFSFPLKDWKESLHQCLQKLQQASA